MTYITKQGDTWDQIAYDALGDELMVDELMQENLPLLGTMVFPAGVVINLPEGSDEYDDDDNLLPDWRLDDDPDDSDEDDDATYDEDDDDEDVDTDDDEMANEEPYDGVDMG